MQTLFDSSGLEEESLCPQQLRKRRRREKEQGRRERRGEEVCKWVGVSGRFMGGWVDRIGCKKSTHSGSGSAWKTGELRVNPLQVKKTYFEALPKTSTYNE